MCVDIAGIWQEGEDGTDVNACAKANRRPLLASADDFGRVNLYKYPCCQLKVKRYYFSIFEMSRCLVYLYNFVCG